MPYPVQATNVHVERIGDELCIYDWQRKHVHSLNPTAAQVWQRCDGQTSPAEIGAALQSTLGVPNAEEVVWLTLAQLERAHLLTAAVVKPSGRRVLPRRQFFKLGMAAALLPVIHSIVAPSLVAAQSPVPTPTIPIPPPQTPVTPTDTPVVPTDTPVTPTDTPVPTITPTPSVTPTPTMMP